MRLFANLRLLTRTSLIIAVTLLGFFLLSVWLDYRQQVRFVIEESVEKSRLISFEAIRIRDYLSRQLQQGKIELPVDQVGLIPMVATGRIGQQVAEDLDYQIRQISDRYRNPKNAPDPFEAEVLRQFREADALSEKYQITEQDGARVFRYLMPFQAEQSCLECHGQPEDAPQIIRQLFPKETDRAYYYQQGEIIGAMSISIPMTKLEEQIFANLRNDMLTSGGMFLALIGCLGLLMRASVLAPLTQLGSALQQIVRSGEFRQQLPERGGDEVGQLIRGFNEMVAHLGEKTRQLEESEARYRMLTDTARDGIVSFLADGKIILFNQQAGKLFGYSKLETLGMSIENLIHPDFEEFHVLGAEDYLQQHGEQMLQELQLLPGRQRDGRRVDLELSLSKVESEEHLFYTAIVRKV